MFLTTSLLLCLSCHTLDPEIKDYAERERKERRMSYPLAVFPEKDEDRGCRSKGWPYTCT